MDMEKIAKWMELAQNYDDSDFWQRVFQGRADAGLSAAVSEAGSESGCSQFTRAQHFPPADVYQSGGETIVVADVPGVRRADMHLAVVGDMLTIKGTRLEPANGVLPVSLERVKGAFERTVKLPVTPDPASVTARLDAGVLIIRFTGLTVHEGYIAID